MRDLFAWEHDFHVLSRLEAVSLSRMSFKVFSPVEDASWMMEQKGFTEGLHSNSCAIPLVC